MLENVEKKLRVNIFFSYNERLKKFRKEIN